MPELLVGLSATSRQIPAFIAIGDIPFGLVHRSWKLLAGCCSLLAGGWKLVARSQ
jgi:hypothetical protein